jgi:hypothetical protein
LIDPKKGYGIFERPLVISKGKKEMVACAADHPDRVDSGPDRAWRKLGAGAIHLYAILNMQKNANPEKSVETMLVLAMGCLLAQVLFHWKAGLYFSLGFGAIGILSGYLSAQIAWVWMGLGQVLGRITNSVLLSLLFVLVVIPVAFFRRIKGRDRLSRFDAEATSHFISRDHLFVKGDLEKTW